ncbi:hypothetical protein HDU84_008219 [Entophlyctis sp. JEL0112]|nr:hypothetical protein HDU84_008219 [Entophlyctis sp. JEL0112]
MSSAAKKTATPSELADDLRDSDRDRQQQQQQQLMAHRQIQQQQHQHQQQQQHQHQLQLQQQQNQPQQQQQHLMMTMPNLSRPSVPSSSSSASATADALGINVMSMPPSMPTLLGLVGYQQPQQIPLASMMQHQQLQHQTVNGGFPKMQTPQQTQQQQQLHLQPQQLGLNQKMQQPQQPQFLQSAPQFSGPGSSFQLQGQQQHQQPQQTQQQHVPSMQSLLHQQIQNQFQPSGGFVNGNILPQPPQLQSQHRRSVSSQNQAQQIGSLLQQPPQGQTQFLQSLNSSINMNMGQTQQMLFSQLHGQQSPTPPPVQTLSKQQQVSQSFPPMSHVPHAQSFVLPSQSHTLQQPAQPTQNSSQSQSQARQPQSQVPVPSTDGNSANGLGIDPRVFFSANAGNSSLSPPATGGPASVSTGINISGGVTAAKTSSSSTAVQNGLSNEVSSVRQEESSAQLRDPPFPTSGVTRHKSTQHTENAGPEINVCKDEGVAENTLLALFSDITHDGDSTGAAGGRLALSVLLDRFERRRRRRLGTNGGHEAEFDISDDEGRHKRRRNRRKRHSKKKKHIAEILAAEDFGIISKAKKDLESSGRGHNTNSDDEVSRDGAVNSSRVRAGRGSGSDSDSNSSRSESPEIDELDERQSNAAKTASSRPVTGGKHVRPGLLAAAVTAGNIASGKRVRKGSSSSNSSGSSDSSSSENRGARKSSHESSSESSASSDSSSKDSGSSGSESTDEAKIAKAKRQLLQMQQKQVLKLQLQQQLAQQQSHQSLNPAKALLQQAPISLLSKLAKPTKRSSKPKSGSHSAAQPSSSVKSEGGSSVGSITPLSFGIIPKKPRARQWTTKEDYQLTRAVRMYGNAWDRVESKVDGRNKKQCQDHWNRILSKRADNLRIDAMNIALQNSINKSKGGPDYQEISDEDPEMLKDDGGADEEYCLSIYVKMKMKAKSEHEISRLTQILRSKEVDFDGSETMGTCSHEGSSKRDIDSGEPSSSNESRLEFDLESQYIAITQENAQLRNDVQTLKDTIVSIVQQATRDGFIENVVLLNILESGLGGTNTGEGIQPLLDALHFSTGTVSAQLPILQVKGLLSELEDAKAKLDSEQRAHKIVKRDMVALEANYTGMLRTAGAMQATIETLDAQCKSYAASIEVLEGRCVAAEREMNATATLLATARRDRDAAAAAAAAAHARAMHTGSPRVTAGHSVRAQTTDSDV